MLTCLKIERFKSIRYLELECRRVNLLIGEPNTGKSNILEALGLLSWCSTDRPLSAFVRAEHPQHLFYDFLTDEPIRIECQGKPAGTLCLRLENEQFSFFFNSHRIGRISAWGGGGLGAESSKVPELSMIRKYRFRFPEQSVRVPGKLIPPNGENLFAVISGSKSLREWIEELFRTYGLSVVLKPHEQVLELQKVQDGLAISYPFRAVSETLQRIVFYYVAMASNRDAVLVFEEPEAHAFPYYTKYLGEQIAADSSNQYFIATHNPYFLTAVLEKANREEVAVFAVHYKDYETKVTALTDGQISRLLDADPFLGLNAVLENG
ncbi:MAG: AAA family ATPase [Armatimonadota bacterium]